MDNKTTTWFEYSLLHQTTEEILTLEYRKLIANVYYDLFVLKYIESNVQSSWLRADNSAASCQYHSTLRKHFNIYLQTYYSQTLYNTYFLFWVEEWMKK